MIKGILIFVFMTLILITFTAEYNKDWRFEFKHLVWMLDFFSFLYILVSGIALTIGIYSWNSFKNIFYVPFIKSKQLDQLELNMTLKCVRYWGNISIALGLYGIIISLVLYLNYIGTPSMTGPVVAKGVHSIGFCILIKGLCMSLSGKIEQFIK